MQLTLQNGDAVNARTVDSDSRSSRTLFAYFVEAAPTQPPSTELFLTPKIIHPNAPHLIILLFSHTLHLFVTLEIEIRLPARRLLRRSFPSDVRPTSESSANDVCGQKIVVPSGVPTYLPRYPTYRDQPTIFAGEEHHGAHRDSGSRKAFQAILHGCSLSVQVGSNPFSSSRSWYPALDFLSSAHRLRTFYRCCTISQPSSRVKAYTYC